MDIKESDRLRTRLLAIDLRLAELDHELRRTQAHVSHLESQMEDVRLANLMGEEAGDSAELAPELERSRGSLESQRELVAQVKKSQWHARVAYTLTRAQERRAERLAGENEAA